jgi:WD40 repeat protein
VLVLYLAAACVPAPTEPTATPSRLDELRQPTVPPPSYREPFFPVTLDNVETVELLGRLDPDQPNIGSVSSYAFATDSTQLAALTRERVLSWDLITGELVFGVPRDGGIQVFYAADKTEVYTVSSTGRIRILDGTSGQLLTALEGQPDYAGIAAYAPFDGRLALVDSGGNVNVWDPVTRDLLVRFTSGDARVTDMAFSEDGTQFAISTAAGTVEIWDWQAREQLAVLQDPDDEPIGQVVFAPGGVQVAAGTEADVRLWDLNERQLTHILLTGAGGAEDVLAYTPAGDLLVNSGLTEAMNIWNPVDGELVAALPELGGQRTAAAFNPSGALMLAGVFEGGVFVYNFAELTETGPQRAELTVDRPIIDVSWSADGRTLAVFDTRGSVHIFGVPAPLPTPTPDATPLPTLPPPGSGQ